MRGRVCAEAGGGVCFQEGTENQEGEEMTKLFLALMAAYVLAIGTVVSLAAPVVSGYMEKFDQAIWRATR